MTVVTTMMIFNNSLCIGCGQLGVGDAPSKRGPHQTATASRQFFRKRQTSHSARYCRVCHSLTFMCLHSLASSSSIVDYCVYLPGWSPHLLLFVVSKRSVDGLLFGCERMQCERDDVSLCSDVRPRKLPGKLGSILPEEFGSCERTKHKKQKAAST